MTHTKGPWQHEEHFLHGVIRARSFGSIAKVYGSNPVCKANAARIVSCVNALEGLNPDAVADVVAALEAMTDLAHGYAEYIASVPSSELERHPYLPGVEDEINSARTALARIRGEG